MQGLTLQKGVQAANAAFSLYSQLWNDKPDQEVMKRTVVDLETDYLFLSPTQQALALHNANAR